MNSCRDRLIDVYTEHAMGLAQPQSEQVQPLSEQLNKMKVRKREGWKVYGVVDEYVHVGDRLIDV